MTDDKGTKAMSMLVAFRATNVRSFRDPMEFSMEATALAESGVPRELPWRLGGRTRVRILPAAGIFGANASGKTNLLRAMDDMRRLVQTSFGQPNSRRRRPRRIHRHPFKLDPAWADTPSKFEIEVIISGIRHVYGFEVDDYEVISEQAVHYQNGRPVTIFARSGRDFHFSESMESQSEQFKKLTRHDTLFLSVAGALEVPELAPLIEWFDANLDLCAASSREARWNYTAKMLDEPALRERVLELIRIADLGITDITTLKPPPEMLERINKMMQLFRDSDDDSEVFEIDLDSMVHFQMSHYADGNIVALDSTEESLGTLVWFGIVGPVLSALHDGTVLLVDELESSLHPSLVAQLVKIFQSPVSNPNGAQIIFNSHEARLLGNSADDRTLGRDQAWFAEKSHNGATKIYPLTDFAPRKSEAIARRYTEGRYGATPIVSSAEFMNLASEAAAG